MIVVWRFLQIIRIVSFDPFKVEVLFYEDGRTGICFESQITHLLPGFKDKRISDTVKKNKKVHSAAKTAMINYFFQQDFHLQFIPK